MVNLCLGCHKRGQGVIWCDFTVKHYKRNISHNKIHQHLLVVGLARHNRKKQKKRKRCRYERKHSLSLVHADWLDYDGTQVIAYEDDTSRKILAADECDSANIENGIHILGKTVKEVEFYGPIKALLSDNGSEFSNHWNTKKNVQPVYFRSIWNNMG